MKIRVRRKNKDLRIYYDGQPDTDLDRALTEVLKSVGWEWWASGYDHLTSQRDLAFDYTGGPPG